MSEKNLMNRIWNTSNRYQMDYKRVLCVCSGGLLRSPTAAVVLASPPFNFNTRAAGVDEDHALIAVDEILLNWAQEIVCMSRSQMNKINKLFPEFKTTPKFILDIPDKYEYRNPELIELIKTRYIEESGWTSESKIS